MNSTQKLTDEALQVYRATGLSPLQVLEKVKELENIANELQEKVYDLDMELRVRGEYDE